MESNGVEWMFLLRVAYRLLSEATTCTCDQEGSAQPHSFLLLLLRLRCAMHTAILTVQCLHEVLDCHTTWVCLNGLSCRGDQDAIALAGSVRRAFGSSSFRRGVGRLPFSLVEVYVSCGGSCVGNGQGITARSKRSNGNCPNHCLTFLSILQFFRLADVLGHFNAYGCPVLRCMNVRVLRIVCIAVPHQNACAFAAPPRPAVCIRNTVIPAKPATSFATIRDIRDTRKYIKFEGRSRVRMQIEATLILSTCHPFFVTGLANVPSMRSPLKVNQTAMKMEAVLSDPAWSVSHPLV